MATPSNKDGEEQVQERGNCASCGEVECVETAMCGCKFCHECGELPTTCSFHIDAVGGELCKECTEGLHSHSLTCTKTTPGGTSCACMPVAGAGEEEAESEEGDGNEE